LNKGDKMANKWELFLTLTPYPACVPFSNNNVTMTYRVSGDNCGAPYPCGTIQSYGESCSDTIQPLITEMINYFKTHSAYNPLMTDTDTIYINGILYTSATHMVELQLSPNPYISTIEQNILQISSELAKYIPADPDIQYLKTEFSNGVAKVYLKWIGPPATMSSISGTELLHAGYSTGYNTQSLITIDDINNSISNFIKLWIIPGIIVAVGFVLATGLLSSGLTLPALVGAAIAVSSLFVISYIVHDLMAQVITAQETIKNLQAFTQITSAKDAGYKALDDSFTTCTQSGRTDCCLTLLQGYQKIDQTYISEFKDRLPNMDLTTATKSYIDCTNILISQFNAGTITCDTARANFGPCRDGLYNSSDVEFGTKYDANKNYTKPTNWLALGLIGFATVLGVTMMTGKGKETIVLKS